MLLKEWKTFIEGSGSGTGYVNFGMLWQISAGYHIACIPYIGILYRVLESNDLVSYLLIGALSPVLHVEGSRTRSGIIVGANISSFCHNFSLLWPSTYYFPHLLHCDSSLLFSSSLFIVLFTVYHCYSSLLWSLLFVTAFRRCSAVCCG